MNRAIQRQNAKKFIHQWKGYEKGETQKFWISLLHDVLGVPDAAALLDFEKQVVVDGQTKFIDAYIKSTKVLIEQKGANIDLNKKYKQSGGAMLTPFEQAKRYAADLGVNLYPHYIVVCNFKEFHIHDMRDTSAPPVVIKLEDLPQQVHRLAFLADVDKEITAFEQKISVEAGEIVGQIYDALLEQYRDKSNPESLKSLNKLCVRLVFCLYAEDSGLFANHLQFHDYLRVYSHDPRTALINLFKVLNTPEDKRDPYLSDDLAAFPYVNGGLFADENIEIPKLTPQIVELILKKASESFDWSLISPTIFGAVFESTLNPETRRKGGMHYTSVENIHKVIDPLFLNELKEELKNALELKVPGTRNKRLEAFRKKLGSLTFLDPACGSGNFLTETYKCLRELENEALREIYQGQMALGEDLSPIEVHIKQFYGIEINDFAVTVARTALWIAESQMMKETEDIVGESLDFLPLKSSAHIHEGNALRMDWNSVIPASKLNYIMGNPPFLGAMNMDSEQREDISKVFPECEQPGQVDYVSGWFVKAIKYAKGTPIEISFVATNSICQGAQVPLLWKPLSEMGATINFAYTNFVWDSEASEKAHVHCVIVGFSEGLSRTKKIIFQGNVKTEAKWINSYLMDARDCFIKSRSKPISPVSGMYFGSMPRDGGNLIFSPEERELLISKEKGAEKFLKKFTGANEFLNNKERWVLWLDGVSPSEYESFPTIMKRIDQVRKFREKSVAKATQKYAETPAIFCQIAQPDSDYLIVPSVSSEKRKYIPIGYLDKNVIASNLALIVPNASYYEFGILTSSIHMAWVRAVAGRLEMRYRYSKDVVYNNFPWPTITEKTRKKVEETAKRILDVRNRFTGCSLASLYNPSKMPKELLQAHKENDRAVMKAYGFKPSMTESEIVSELFKLYEVRIKELEQEEEKKKKEEKGSKEK